MWDAGSVTNSESGSLPGRGWCGRGGAVCFPTANNGRLVGSGPEAWKTQPPLWVPDKIFRSSRVITSFWRWLQQEMLVWGCELTGIGSHFALLPAMSSCEGCWGGGGRGRGRGGGRECSLPPTAPEVGLDRLRQSLGPRDWFRGV